MLFPPPIKLTSTINAHKSIKVIINQFTHFTQYLLKIIMIENPEGK